jgi:hypothetical protein
VRDYQRLSALFPYTYRREHQAEMVGHLLETAAPDQSRPTPGERSDLLRAAAREWLLAPFGSTARQRRDGTRWLLVMLPLLLVPPAAAALGAGSGVFAMTGDLRDPFSSTPFSPAWTLWLVGMLVLVLGALRTARVVLVVAAATAWATVALLCARGELSAAYTEVGWAVGQTACAIAVEERSRWGLPLRWAPWKRAMLAAVAAVPALSVAWIAQAGFSAPERWGGRLALSQILGTGATLVLLGLGTSTLLCSRQARQCVPVLAGVVSAIAIGRTGIFGSRMAPLDVIDLGNVIGLLAVSLALTAASRWVVNRLDELNEARARLGSDMSGPTLSIAE